MCSPPVIKFHLSMVARALHKGQVYRGFCLMKTQMKDKWGERLVLMVTGSMVVASVAFHDLKLPIDCILEPTIHKK